MACTRPCNIKGLRGDMFGITSSTFSSVFSNIWLSYSLFSIISIFELRITASSLPQVSSGEIYFSWMNKLDFFSFCRQHKFDTWWCIILKYENGKTLSSYCFLKFCPYLSWTVKIKLRLIKVISIPTHFEVLKPFGVGRRTTIAKSDVKMKSDLSMRSFHFRGGIIPVTSDETMKSKLSTTNFHSWCWGGGGRGRGHSHCAVLHRKSPSRRLNYTKFCTVCMNPMICRVTCSIEFSLK